MVLASGYSETSNFISGMFNKVTNIYYMIIAQFSERFHQLNMLPDDL